MFNWNLSANFSVEYFFLLQLLAGGVCEEPLVFKLDDELVFVFQNHWDIVWICEVDLDLKSALLEAN